MPCPQWIYATEARSTSQCHWRGAVFFGIRNSRVCWQTICRHMSCQDVKGSKKLAAFGGRLGTSRWYTFSIPYWTVDFPRGKPVPFNYGCFPQTYRDPEKAAKWKDLRVDDRDLTWIQPLICLEGRWALLCFGWWWSLGCVGQPSTTFGEMELDRV